MEFSKKLLYFSWGITISLTVLLIWFSLKSFPIDAITTIAPFSWAETGTATAFYYWKAKNENRAKYAQKFLQEFSKDWDSETAIRMAEVVLKD